MFKSGVKSKRVKSGRKKYKIIEIPEFKKLKKKKKNHVVTISVVKKSKNLQIRKIMWSPFSS